jgi:spore maturation protein CgeB
MGLKSEYINLSSYYKSFTSFDKFLKKKDSRSILENKYVDLLSELVLQVVEERNTDILISVAQAPLSPKVLETCREKGIITVHWFMEDVNRFPTWKQIAKYYDYFFVIQKDSAIERIKDVGGKRVHYLPLACDPFIHKKINVSEEEKEIFGSTMSFVGAGYNNRRYVFSKYARDDFKIWGTEWPDVVPFSHMVQRSGARVSVEDYTKVFNCSLININLHSSHEKNGVDPTGDFVNPRTFELAACKAFQLVDKRSLLSDLFNNDEIATFETENELREKIDYFSAKPEERNSYIEKSYKKVIEKHTYQQRIKSILEYVYADYGSHLSSRSKNDNWNRTLDAERPFSELCSMLEEVKERGDEPSIDALVAPLLNTKGVLDDTKKKLMFLHHMRGQISQINKLRNPNET